MPITESEKVFRRILPLIEGKSVLDLGCGMKKIAPWAIGVDDASESKHIRDAFVQACVDPDSRELDDKVSRDFDVVFSSHTLEHVRAPLLETIEYWASFVKPGGCLILYLPDEDRYRFDPKNPAVKNPQHVYLLTPKMFHEVLERIENLSIETFESDPQIHDHYSFLVVLRKPQ
jgi:SAM-dependent methyltransferase